MSLFKSLFRGGSAEQEIKSKGFEISECEAECGGCSSKFPKMSLDTQASLYGSSKEYGLHFAVSTGKSDWSHDACGDKGTFAKKVSDWASDTKIDNIGTIKVTASSLPVNDNDEEYTRARKGDILILPLFVWIKNVHNDKTEKVLDAIVPDLVSRRDKKQPVKLKYDKFPEVKVEVDNSHSYIFLCSHRTRDKRCGITAPIMKKELDIYSRELGMIRDFGDDRPGGINVAFINHIGGHKYAANVIIYVKERGDTIWLARCVPQNAKPIIDECVLKGSVWPEKVRLVQKSTPIDW